MHRYALLLLPSANRVYADAAAELTLAELEAFDGTVLGGRLRDAAVTDLGGVPYVTFTADELDDRSVAYLSNASAMYALFRIESDLLRPVPPRRCLRATTPVLPSARHLEKTTPTSARALSSREP